MRSICLQIAMPRISPSAGRQISPGNARDLHSIYPPHIQTHPPGWLWGFEEHCLLTRYMPASYAISVRRARVLPAASFRFRVTPDTLAVRLTVPTIRVRRGLAPPSHKSATMADSMGLTPHAPCRAHNKKGTYNKCCECLIFYGRDDKN